MKALACLLILMAASGHGTDVWLRGAAAAPLPEDLSVPVDGGDDRVAAAMVSAVRLVGGGSPLQGRLETNFGGTWGAVCSIGFDVKDALVVCRQLRLAGGAVSAKFTVGALPYALGNMQCHGDETSLAGCRFKTTNRCKGGRPVGIICRNAPVVAARLYDNTYERPEGAQRGRLEVQLLRRGWGTVCDSAGTFGKREATVACRTLNLTGGVVLRKSEFQNSEQCCGIRPILMGNVKCKGGEASLSGCSYTTSPKCTPEQEVGVMCDEPPPVQVRLVNGKASNNGRLEVRVGGKWGTVCGTGFNQAAAQVVCRKLNMTGGKPRYGAVYGKGKLPILLSNLRCRGGESELSACLFSASTKQCTHANDVGVACKLPKITNLVIYGGGLDGFLQAFVEGQQDPYYPTTTICADGFTAREARVACRMLGMAGGEVAPAVPAPLPIVTAPKAITGVKCKGNEGDLSACTYAINGFCKNRRAAGVICEPAKITRARLVGGPKGHPNWGRLEVRVGSQFGSICDLNFGDVEADVACRQVGYSSGRLASFGKGLPFVIERVSCFGNETSLSECTFTTGDDCRRYAYQPPDPMGNPTGTPVGLYCTGAPK
ncbi:hypothetical protein CHLNCDRAFT_144239 [Chlorella variabilis]|uniref:SRCR domain-containing protein n=1 Tax=Chlorella variabilis TaxID=554065 RepID=E1ZC86_CHLVA|nr:hypothetical protein CHLNCDRAFT_144239 [Chlorella variabilis]EFN56568.1 hypothetical protein CHLNCDRAFT_144239 [Chlorella variabilis]|eukprot:XP_005848670.1 hypothetical protein CHLNCDRAFT_144239 [Chlorella variabilis]